MVKLRRKTISDSLIDDEFYFKILTAIVKNIGDSEPTQKDIIKLGLELNLSNNMIAKIVNDLIPNARATAGSIASALRVKRKQLDLVRELELKLLEEL